MQISPQQSLVAGPNFAAGTVWYGYARLCGEDVCTLVARIDPETNTVVAEETLRDDVGSYGDGAQKGPTGVWYHTDTHLIRLES